MRRRRSLIVAVPSIALSFVLCSTFALAQEKKDGYGKDKPAAGMQDKGAPGSAAMPSPEEMGKMMEMMGKVGEEHKKLAESAGTWDADVKFWMDPSAPPSSSTGTMKMEPMWDGRYMKMDFEGSMDMGGQKVPFKGMGFIGYENAKQMYWSTWMDSMSTGLNKSEGKMEGNKIVMHGLMFDPMTKQDMKTREVTTHKDKDHMMFEMFCAGPDGKEMKMMEINYTRQK